MKVYPSFSGFIVGNLSSSAVPFWTVTVVPLRKVGGVESVLGMIPNYEDIDWTGLNFSKEQFNNVTKLDKETWLSELAGVKEWFAKMGPKLPAKLAAIRDAFETKFKNS